MINLKEQVSNFTEYAVETIEEQHNGEQVAIESQVNESAFLNSDEIPGYVTFSGDTGN